MTTCDAVGREMDMLVALPPAEIPDWVGSHVAACPACGRRLAAARLARGLILAGAETISPPDGFADRVRIALAARSAGSRADVDVWRPAWGLIPTFAASVLALFIVYQTSEGPGPSSLLPIEGLSAGEYLVLGAPGPEMDDIVTAVLGGGGQ